MTKITKMSNLSIRAFDQSQRRKKYPERKGYAGLSYIQKDLLIAQKNIAEISEILWAMTGENGEFADGATSANVYQKISDIGLILLQISGSLGIDFVSIIKHRVEKEELTII